LAARRKYKKKSTAFVTAVQLDLDTEGFKYNKWGGKQVCKKGDWLVNNNGETYTVAEASFAQTYEFVSPGVYVKPTPVWAEIAAKPGRIKTKEGETAYRAGDYLVFNNEDGTDGYAMSAKSFKSMYEPAHGKKLQSK
jgi:hypothetical protein